MKSAPGRRRLASDTDEEVGRSSSPNSTSWVTCSISSVDYRADSFERSVSNDNSKELLSVQRRAKSGEMDVDKYMADREMTPLQERLNAITVIPGAFYCLLFLLSGLWLNKGLEDEAREEILGSNYVLPDKSSCISLSWLPRFYALPPLPVAAVAFGIILHAPFSFLYHWHYSHRLPPGLPRTAHWSRRMDQAMIHVCSASMAYATSGGWDFFVINLFFNLESIYRLFGAKVRPRRNKIRLLISVVAYTIPIIKRGDFFLFGEIWFLLATAFWFFGLYPIGGWSHSVFHIILAFVPPLLMEAAMNLPASQGQMRVAAQCAAIANSSLEA